MDARADYPQAGMYVMGRCLIVSVQVELYDDVISQIQHAVLAKVRESHLRGVLLDVSMVEVMDAHIAQSLSETLQMVDMLGAHSVMVGIRPAVASALMDLDRPPLHLRTAVTLEQGMSLLEPFIQETEPVVRPAEAVPDDAFMVDAPAVDAEALPDDDRASFSDEYTNQTATALIDPEDASGQ